MSTQHAFALEVEKMRESLKDVSVAQPEPRTLQEILNMQEAVDKAMMSISPASPRRFQKLDLLEVYADMHSPLTEHANRVGLRAQRFTRQDGDLASVGGRQRLWEIIVARRPTHIWLAPECGPWGGWNRLNMFRSRALFDSVSQAQFDQLAHVRLAARLCEYQSRVGGFFHLEQPSGSSMPTLPEFETVRQHAHQAAFDMCAFGLKIPNTQKFIRKSSQVWTTSMNVFQLLDGRRCPKNHEHHQIAGTIRIMGKLRSLSRFCATYCSGFAWRVARTLRQPDLRLPLPPRGEQAMVGEIPEHAPAQVVKTLELTGRLCRLIRLSVSASGLFAERVCCVTCTC